MELNTQQEDMKKLNCIMLVDDHEMNNTFNEWLISKIEAAEKVVSYTSAKSGLEYLNNPKNKKPDLILLDINMPGMNGWEFLDEYQKQIKNGGTVVVMLSSSDDPSDIQKSEQYAAVRAFKSKPLTKETLVEITEKYF